MFPLLLQIPRLQIFELRSTAPLQLHFKGVTWCQ